MTATVVGSIEKDVVEIILPAKVQANSKSYRVVSIGDGAFKGLSKLEKVTISKYISSIGKTAFAYCKKLSRIEIQTVQLSMDSIHESAFKSTGKGITVLCPAKKLNDYKEILLKKGLSKKTMFQ